MDIEALRKRFNVETIGEEFNPEYYDEEYDEYYTPKFRADMAEVLEEEKYMMEHLDEFKLYTSTKEMFRDMGFDVSNFPDR